MGDGEGGGVERLLEDEEDGEELVCSGRVGSLHDISQPVDFGIFDWVDVEEVVLHEADTAICKSLRVLFRPDCVLALLEYWTPVLHYKLQFWVEFAELEIETACECGQMR